MGTRKSRVFFGLLACGICPVGAQAQATDQQISDQLRPILESAPVPLVLEIGGEEILATRALPAFYEQRVYKPAWINGFGPGEPLFELVGFLETVGQEGLDPDDYHAERILDLLESMGKETAPWSAASAAELDLLATDSFLLLGAHLVSGRVDPTNLDREWLAVRREVDLVQTLNAALGSGEIEASLAALLPDLAGYFRLRDLGVQFRQLVENGGWQPVSPGPTLRLGDRSPRVVELRGRLAVTDGLVPVSADPDETLFDESVDTAVRHFQTRHGLFADGVVGDRTLAALNLSAADRLRQIYLNLERWRWLPQSLGARYVLVNLPAFELQVVEAEETVLVMRVAVGRRYRHTPVFSDTIRYLVFNPYWEIPASIAVNDKLPEIRQDPGYLQKQGIRVLLGWGAEQAELDPTTIDWNALGAGRFPYRLRQDPGPLNALGRVKFMFPNNFNVYLHDTPGREAFARAERDISSGCIRLERPLDLAELLLSGNSGWQRGNIEEYLRGYQERTVRLDTPWSVHLLHWTAWVDQDGVAHFRSDLYERDRKLLQALGGSLPDVP